MLNALKKLESLLRQKLAPSSKSPKPSAHTPKEPHKPKRIHIPKETYKPARVYAPKEARLPKREPGFGPFTEEDWIYYKYLQHHLPSFINTIKTATPQDLADEMDQSLMAMDTGRPLNNYQKLLISAYFICPIPTLEIPEIATWLIEYATKKSLSSKLTLNKVPQEHDPST